MVFNSTEEGSEKLRERVDRQLGREILKYSEALGLGSTDYELINIE
jgi:uncharacterized Fe-S center protein